MSDQLYRISDEPRPGSLERFVTDSNWPLFGLMLGGAWLGFPWFVFNGVALGSATLRREILLAGAGFAGAAVLALAMFFVLGNKLLPMSAVPFLLPLPIVWKLGIGYLLVRVQHRSFALWEHFGGTPRRAFLVLVAGLVIRTSLDFGNLFWVLVLL